LYFQVKLSGKDQSDIIQIEMKDKDSELHYSFYEKKEDEESYHAHQVGKYLGKKYLSHLRY
jgi:hypothetical protein